MHFKSFSVAWLAMSSFIVHPLEVFVKQLQGKPFLLKPKLPFVASMSKTLHPSCITGREGLQHRTCQSKMWINVAKGKGTTSKVLERLLTYYRGVQSVVRGQNEAYRFVAELAKGTTSCTLYYEMNPSM